MSPTSPIHAGNVGVRSTTQNTALFPLTDLFQRLLQFQAEDTPDEKLAKLEQTLSQYRLPLEESVPLFAPLLSLPIPEHRYPPLNFSPQRQRQKTLEAIVAILLELAEHQPVLFILEDLHWTDPTTLELLNSGDRPDTHGFPPWCCSPVVHIFNLPGITARISQRSRSIAYHTPGGTDGDTHDRWQNLPTRGARNRSSTRRMACHFLSRK